MTYPATSFEPVAISYGKPMARVPGDATVTKVLMLSLSPRDLDLLPEVLARLGKGSGSRPQNRNIWGTIGGLSYYPVAKRYMVETRTLF